MEEDTELKDLIIQKALAPNGALAKIKAQLRASIFLALAEDENLQKKEPLQNKQVKEQLQTPEGKIAFALVHEFLDYCDLQFTANVYEKESYSDLYEYETRDKLVNEIKQTVPQVQNNINQPLLVQLIKVLKNKQTNEDKNGSNDSSSEKIDSYSSISSELENTNSSDNSRLCNDNKCVTDVKTKPKENKLNVTYNISPLLKSEQKIDDSKKGKSSLTSLADLPPIQLNKQRGNETMLLPSLYKKEKSSLHDVDKSIDVEFDNLDSYEEDVLMSPISNGNLDNAKINLLDSIKAELSGNKNKERLQTADGILDKLNQNETFSSTEKNGTSKNSIFENNTALNEDFELNNVDDILNSSASN